MCIRKHASLARFFLCGTHQPEGPSEQHRARLITNPLDANFSQVYSSSFIPFISIMFCLCQFTINAPMWIGIMGKNSDLLEAGECDVHYLFGSSGNSSHPIL